MTDLRQQLRDGDGGPTSGPDHQAIRTRGRRLKMVRTGGLTSAVVAAAVLVVGAVWQVADTETTPTPPVIGEVGPDPEPGPREDPGDSRVEELPDDSGVASTFPQHPLLATDGHAVFTIPEAAGDDRDRWQVLATLDDIGRAVALAPRPGTDPDAPEAVLLLEVEDRYELHALLEIQGELVIALLHATGQPTDAGMSRSPQPTWHPDGEHVAWLEHTEDGHALRVVAWDDVRDAPQSAEPAEVIDLGLPAGEVARLDVWSPEEQSELLWFTVSDGWSWYVIIDLAGNGEIEVARRAQRRDHIGEEAGTRVVAQTAATYMSGVEYTLLDDGPLHLFDQAGHQGLQLPDKVVNAAPEQVWLADGNGEALVGTDDQAWLIRRPSDTTPIHLQGTITHATAIP